MRPVADSSNDIATSRVPFDVGQLEMFLSVGYGEVRRVHKLKQVVGSTQRSQNDILSGRAPVQTVATFLFKFLCKTKRSETENSKQQTYSIM